MAGVIRKNPITVVSEFEQIGKKITWFNVLFAADPTASTGPEGAIQAVYSVIQKTGVIIAAGPISSSSQSFGIEGIFSDQTGLDGVEVGDLLRMQNDIKALGTIDGVALVGATVVAKQLIIT